MYVLRLDRDMSTARRRARALSPSALFAHVFARDDLEVLEARDHVQQSSVGAGAGLEIVRLRFLGINIEDEIDLQPEVVGAVFHPVGDAGKRQAQLGYHRHHER